MKKVLSGLFVFLFFACDTAIPETLSKKYYYTNNSLSDSAVLYLNGISENGTATFSTGEVYKAVTKWPAVDSYGVPLHVEVIETDLWEDLSDEMLSLGISKSVVDQLQTFCSTSGAASYIYQNTNGYGRAILIDAAEDGNLYR